MATGYTEMVREGKVTSFRRFALMCARAFGANVLMRDEPADTPIRVYKPDTFYKEQIDEATEKLYDLERMTLAEAARQQGAENAKRQNCLHGSTDDKRIDRQRYESMLAKVQAWEPPTPDHVSLKAFMVQQLKESIASDCYDPTEYFQLDMRTPQEYLRDQIAMTKDELTTAATRWAEEQKRTKERNDWNQALFDSLTSER